MSLYELYEQIESRWFSAYVNAASGLSVVRLEFEQNATIRQLTAYLEQSPEGRQQTLVRVQSLLHTATSDDDFALLHDAAVAAYLYVLNLTAPQLAAGIIDSIAETPKLFWAKRLANHLQSIQPNFSGK